MTASVQRAASPWDPRADRKAYVVWMAAVWFVVIAGFGLDFSRYLAETPPPPVFLHFHAAVFVAWLGLVSTQIFLVEKGNIALHKRLGWATAIVSASMIPIGLAAAMIGEAAIAGTPGADPQFLSLEFEEMFAFTTFTVAGLLMRRDPAAHKRLMILSAIAISDAGSGRLWVMGIKATLPGPFGWWLKYFWGIALLLIAMAAWDLWRRQKVHPAILAGACVLIGGEIVATTLFFSPGWKVAMTELVRAWPIKG